jgi:undecaprenyl-diphosphatase
MNYHLFTLVHGLAGDRPIDAVMRFSARYLIFAVFGAVALLCLRQLARREVTAVMSTGVALAVTFALGLAAAAAHPELRPFQTHHVTVLVAHAAGQSFPSDHATAAFGVALAVLAFLSRPWGLVLLAVAALIGFARVYDGIHYPGDVAGSLLVAIVGVGLVVAAKRVAAATIA